MPVLLLVNAEPWNDEARVRRIFGPAAHLLTLPVAQRLANKQDAVAAVYGLGAWRTALTTTSTQVDYREAAVAALRVLFVDGRHRMAVVALLNADGKPAGGQPSEGVVRGKR